MGKQNQGMQQHSRTKRHDKDLVGGPGAECLVLLVLLRVAAAVHQQVLNEGAERIRPPVERVVSVRAFALLPHEGNEANKDPGVAAKVQRTTGAAPNTPSVHPQ